MGAAAAGAARREPLPASQAGRAEGDARGGSGEPQGEPQGERREGELPVTGRVLPGLEGVDQAVLPILEAHGFPGAQVAIAHGGALMVARGYGWADVQRQVAMRPETLMVLASVSKVMTAQTTLKLVQEGRLRLDDRVFNWFREPPPPGMREDPRLNEITVEMCLHHTGGWDRKTAGDPSAWGPRIRRALRLNHEPTPLEMIRYMKGVRLNFDPGTRQVYSNFGFVLLGAIIAEIGRQAYPEYVQQHTLQPWGVRGMRLDEAPPDYFEGEARRYMVPGEHALPGGNSRMVMASGGWAASCVDMARVMTAIDGTRTGQPWLSPELMQAMVQPARGIQSPSPQHWMGLGWDQVERFPPAQPGGPDRYSWGKDGGLSGIETWVQHLPLGAGVDFVLMFNSGVQHNSGMEGALGQIRPKVIEFIRAQQSWPQGDLFAQFGGGAGAGGGGAGGGGAGEAGAGG